MRQTSRHATHLTSSDPKPIRPRLDTALCLSAGFAMLLAVSAVCWSLASRRAPLQYATGDRFASIEDLNLAVAPATLILWVNSRCGACTASMSFYRRLTAQPHRTRIVVMGRESVQRLRDYLAQFDVRPAQVISSDDPRLKFAGTPTLALLGADSVVRSVWFGRRQTVTEELEIIRSLD